MATYIVLFNWTEQGVKSYKDSPARVDAAREQWGKAGVQVKDIYWTTGQYDLIAIVEAANGEALAKALLPLGAAGNVRTTSMRAFDQDEFTRLL